MDTKQTLNAKVQKKKSNSDLEKAYKSQKENEDQKLTKARFKKDQHHKVRRSITRNQNDARQAVVW